MISLTADREKILTGARKEPVFGSLIETLYTAYGDFAGLADFYVSHRGGVLCRQGRELTVADNFLSAAEVVAFGRMIGVRTIQGMAGAIDHPIPEDIPVLSRPVMAYLYPACPAPQIAAKAADNLGRVYDIIREGSAPGFDHIDQASFITDTARRRNLQLCEVFTVEDAATAGYYTLGASHGLIACVATLPHSRKRGYGGAAVMAAVAACLERGRIPTLIAENDALAEFYFKLGFVPLGRSLTLDLT